MSVDTAITRWRHRERSLMTATCTVTRPADPGDFDPDSGSYDEDALTGPNVTEVYDGPCLPRPTSRGVETIGAGQELIETQPTVKIPDLDVTFAKGDLVTFTASRDPLLEGRTWTVRDVVVDDFTVWRVLACEEHT